MLVDAPSRGRLRGAVAGRCFEGAPRSPRDLDLHRPRSRSSPRLGKFARTPCGGEEGCFCAVPDATPVARDSTYLCRILGWLAGDAGASPTPRAPCRTIRIRCGAEVGSLA